MKPRATTQRPAVFSMAYTSQRTLHFLPWLSALLAAACYLPIALHLEYVWDDWELFVNNPALRLPETVWQGLVQPILPGTTYFRPLPLATFALEFMAIGAIPALSHGVNLAIHALNTLLVGLIATRLMQQLPPQTRAWRVLLAGLFYGLHPALVEPVAWVAGRFDLLVTLFSLLAIWGHLTLTTWRRKLWVTVCFFLAALSKEMAAMLPVILVLVHLAQQERAPTWRTSLHTFYRSGEWRLYVWLFIAGLAYLALRQTFMGQLSHVDTKVNSELSEFSLHVAFVGQTLLYYFKTSLWPFSDLNPQHPLAPLDIDSSAIIAGWIAVLVTLSLIAVALRARTRPSLLLLSMLVALVPVLNIVPLTIGGNIGHERFLTFPLALLAITVATINLGKNISTAMQRAAPLLLGVLALLWLSLSLMNVRITLPLWQNDLSLWAWSYARHPQSKPIRYKYAAAAIRHNNFEAAQKAINDGEEFDTDFSIKALKGYYLIKNKQLREGIALYKESLTDMEEKLHQQGIEIDTLDRKQLRQFQWYYQFIYTALAEAHISLREFDSARIHAETALIYSPKYPPATRALAFALYGLDRWDEGEHAFAAAMAIYIPSQAESSRDVRTHYLSQLCGIPNNPVTTCKHWEREENRPFTVK